MDSEKCQKRVYIVSFFFSIYSQFYAHICRSRRDEHTILVLDINVLLSPSLTVSLCVCVVNAICHAKCFRFFSLFGMPSLLHCHRRYFQLVFFSSSSSLCSIKKFCSSLSSFRVICLQLNKICKFKADPNKVCTRERVKKRDGKTNLASDSA